MSKKCKPCGKTFNNNNYQLFGISCFKTICELLGVVIPKNIKEKDKEKYLCSLIAKKLNKKRLTIKQKQYLTELYIATLFIDKIEYVNLNKLKKKIQKQIDNMNFFTGIFLPNKDLSMVLYSMYNLYNATDTFKKNLAEIEKMHREEKIDDNVKDDKKVIQYFQYIFKNKKILNPKEYALNYYRQYIFWETVINGGLLFNYKFAIHNAEVIVEGNKNKDNKWDLKIEILDRFDFIDFIFPEEYNDKYKEISENENKTQKQKVVSSMKNGLGYTLNNMALASVQYGVLKEYDVKINFSIYNYRTEGDKND